MQVRRDVAQGRGARTRSLVLTTVLGLLFLWFLVTNVRSARQAFHSLLETVGIPVEAGGDFDVMGDAAVRDHFNKHYTMEELKALYAPWTMVTPQHQTLAIQAVDAMNLENIEGDIVECGVWKGGMTMGMVFANMRHNTDRHFWLFDTFEGLPAPTEKDDTRAKETWERIQNGDASVNDGPNPHRVEDGKWNYGALTVVQNNVFYTNYPRQNFHFIKGKVEDTLPVTTLPEKIAILRLDTDFYESTKIELELLWDRLVPGGTVIIDDFCMWGGARRAVSEFFADRLQLDAVAIAAQQPPCLHYRKPL